MTLHCSACGTVAPEGARYCASCAAPLDGATARVADPMVEALATALGTNYRIERLLGKGGMGAVYLGHDIALDRPVAIKVLPAEAEDAELHERFRREARTAARLTHPGIVPLYTFGDANGMPYFVMGYVRGDSLAQRLRREGKVAPEEARELLAAVADALDYAHRQGVVHRDIKPDNILLDADTGRPMLTDFGVAKAAASGATLTAAGSVVGTPHYMSPEQASGERHVDGRSDIYSLGVTGYLMLAGRLPFDGSGFREVAAQHITRAPPALYPLAPDAPADLVEAVERCLRKDPADRWPDAGRLRDGLRALPIEYDQDLSPLEGSLRGLGAKFVWPVGLVGVIAGAGWIWPAFMGGAWAWWAPAAMVAAGIGAIAGTFIGLAKVQGWSWRRIIDAVMYQPKSWRAWWPRRWRRPGSIWDRLPARIRRARTANAVGLAGVAGMVAGSLPFWRHLVQTPGIPMGPWSLAVLWGCAAFLYGCVGYSAYEAWQWAKTTGLPFRSAMNAWSGPDEMWRQPRLAAFLLSPARAGALPTAGTPDQLVAQLDGAARALPPASRALGEDAVGAARALRGAIERLDAEVAALERDADPAELAAAEERLEALGAELADEGAVRQERRRLLAGQVALARRLGAQLDAARQQRSHMVDLLRDLWLQLAALRADHARDALADSEITGRIRALTEEIGHQAEAQREVQERR